MALKKDYEGSNVKLRYMAEELGLDPSTVTDISATWSTDGPVEIEFTGKIFMPQEAFQQLMEEVRAL